MVGEKLNIHDSRSLVCVRLKEIINKFIDYRGKTPKKVKKGIRLITAKNVKKGYINDEPWEFIESDNYEMWMTRGIPEYGDVVITTEAPLGNVAQLKYEYKYALAQRLITLNIKSKFINKDYIYYQLLAPSFQGELVKMATGTTVLGIKSSKLKELEVIIFSLSEQQRIVTKLDSMLSKLKKSKKILKEIKGNLESQRASILHQAFTGKLTEKWRSENKTESVEILLEQINNERMKKWEEAYRLAKEKRKPKRPIEKTLDEIIEFKHEYLNDWIWVKLGNVTTKIVDGAHKTPKYVEKGIPFISVKNVKNNKIIFDDIRYITEDEHKLLYSRCNPEKGDVLITKSGTIGRTAIVDVDFEFSLFVSVALIKNIKSVILSKFLQYFLEDYINGINIDSDIKGGVIKNFHLNELMLVKVPLPPLEEQKEIVRILENYFKKEEKIKELLTLETQIDLLEKSILSKAFRGELGTSDPNDEPAIELLKRVLEEDGKV